MTQMSKKSGFTIIELMLSMAFISVLLLSIVMISIQAGKMYNRGAVLRSLNQSARDVGDVMRRDFLQANRQQLMTERSGEDLAGVSRDGLVLKITNGLAESGRFCLGQYSYLWNTAKTLDQISDVDDLSTNPAVVTVDGQPINFVRVADPDGALCKQVAGPDNNRYPHALNPDGNITSLLKQPIDKDDVVLSVYNLRVVPLVDRGDEGLFKISYMVGTSKASEIASSEDEEGAPVINTMDQTCKPPNQDESNFDFCAINNFEMIVRTNG